LLSFTCPQYHMVMTEYRLEVESKQPSCEQTMKSRNELLCDTYSTFHATLEKLETYVALALQPDGTLCAGFWLAHLKFLYSNRCTQNACLPAESIANNEANSRMYIYFERNG